MPGRRVDRDSIRRTLGPAERLCRVASSIFIAFGYFFIAGFTLALGTGGYFSPWLAAWLPNLVFAGAAIWLTRRVR